MNLSGGKLNALHQNPFQMRLFLLLSLVAKALSGSIEDGDSKTDEAAALAAAAAASKVASFLMKRMIFDLHGDDQAPLRAPLRYGKQ